MVNGTFNKYSKMKENQHTFLDFIDSNEMRYKTNVRKKHLPMIKPTVTSSGNRIRSLIVINFSFRITGAIFITSERLIQNPAPPVANQN